jgi:hypothetical protein
VNRINSALAVAPLTLALVSISGMCFAGDNDRNSTVNGYYSGTPLGSAAADPYGQNHFYVPGYALSPGMRSYQYGTGQPAYGQPYAPTQRLRKSTPEVGPLHPYGPDNSDENAKSDPYR